jgi:hypothetical protein
MAPDNAIVLAVDEKPSIQALERAQGYLKLPNGRAITGQSHDYPITRNFKLLARTYRCICAFRPSAAASSNRMTLPDRGRSRTRIHDSNSGPPRPKVDF